MTANLVLLMAAAASAVFAQSDGTIAIAASRNVTATPDQVIFR